MCAGLRDFRSEACSARVSGQTRAIFRQKLRCAGCRVKSGEFLSESKQNSCLGKLKRFSVRNLKCAGFWKNRARIGQKIQYADFKANSGGFRSENKMLTFFEQTHAWLPLFLFLSDTLSSLCFLPDFMFCFWFNINVFLLKCKLKTPIFGQEGGCNISFSY